MTRRRDKATSFDIAHLAGVSQPTVSRALRGSPLVSERTRRRVVEIARQLNYKVDKNASNLRFQHSGTLALLLFEDPTRPRTIPSSTRSSCRCSARSPAPVRGRASTC